MRIALLGTRGIPARYGGFETFAEELSVRLAERGHEVAVYCRGAGAERGEAFYRGVRRIVLPAPRHKYLETPVHALISFVDLWRRRFDIVLLCNAANSPFAWIARLRGLPVVINVDGVERKRRKWNALGRLWYRLGERCSVAFASSVVADAGVIARYYRRARGAEAVVIRYGAAAEPRPAGETLRRFGLEPGRYLLYVSRLEPENTARGVITAYNRLGRVMPLAIVGDAPYAQDYIAALKRSAGDGVVFTGYQFGEAYKELRSSCYAYIQATEVGGTHPALVEAMAYGNCTLANATPEHFEVLGGAGLYYRRNDFEHLAERLRFLLGHPDEVQAYGRLARARAERLFRWDTICDQYEALFQELLGRSCPVPASASGARTARG